TVAAVNPSGVATGVGIGSTTVTATQGAVLGSTTVTVTAAVVSSIAVTPATSSIAKGTTVPLTATGTFSDGSMQNLTTQVSWTSANNAIAQVSNVSGSNGRVTGLGIGSTSIIATFGVIQGSATVSVTAATLTQIIVTPTNPTVSSGGTGQLN